MFTLALQSYLTPKRDGILAHVEQRERESADEKEHVYRFLKKAWRILSSFWLIKVRDISSVLIYLFTLVCTCPNCMINTQFFTNPECL